MVSSGSFLFERLSMSSCATPRNVKEVGAHIAEGLHKGLAQFARHDLTIPVQRY